MVLFLQNAWSPVYAGLLPFWPRASWLLALERSRSGQRLKHMIDDFDICENTTPEVGNHPSSKLPPMPEYILSILAYRQPHIVIACGKQAEESLKTLWGGALIAVPHPAHRLVTNELYRTARQIILSSDFQERVALRQKRGVITQESLEAQS